MKTVFLQGSKVGSKTLVSLKEIQGKYHEKYPDHETTFIDLKELSIDFSDGRNYLDYDGDTGFVVREIMMADIIFIGSPTFQASIPATLKNIFDLLPQKALEKKTVGIVMTAGSDKHFLVAEIQLKPILGYMKANIVPNYVFVKDTDVIQQKIVNDEVLFRMDNLIENTVVLATSYQKIWQETEEDYGF
ncbi:MULTISPECIES: NADPH-dependent FMN reductase [Vagococcus]|uniref:FMN reductase n=1 Tax=Vagococcus fluvialis bH819 TaxID=1255619 RepID=A0A1X6WLK3_9ENTE|nr:MULTISPECIES: NADPH-dependent FMN reductase [Vagococcus]SLM85140.1 FMN reductase [Vagococcus fluvialis bH819]HCM88446.1 NAD(P)H-dependent oxidoreductase [Vagococcus sp.]